MYLTQDFSQEQQIAFNLVTDVNMIVSFKYSEEEVLKWVSTIYRLFPDVTIEAISKITDNFLSGVEVFDPSIGIVNYTSKINSYMGKLI